MTLSLLTLAMLAVGYVVGMSAWQAAAEPLLRFSDLLIPRLIDVLVAFWLFFIGSSIGSFLNVVAWRMPRGKSINGRSHCPRCDNRLSWRDNWPVMGWIILGGRCRHCRLPISPRYPIVEAVVGLCVLLVAMRGFYSDATNLPFWPRNFGRATALWVPYLTAHSIAVIIYHITALAAVWAFALVRGNGARIPRNLAGWCLVLVIVPMMVVPFLTVVPWTVSADASWRADRDYLHAIMRVLTGLAMAVMLGQMMKRHLCPNADPKLNPLGEGTARLIDLILLLSIAAVVVGWQAALPVTALAILIGAVVPSRFVKAADPLARFAIGLPIAMSIQIAYWDYFHLLPWWPSVNTAPVVTLLWAAAVFVLPRLLLSALRHTATELDHDPAVPD